ncbi:MAG: polysaccharide biosynthesis protein EpsC [Chloroflexi bacterium]|nr:polysaccharide biosynthesis protein EpsC [Chloroflexota bacterium]
MGDPFPDEYLTALLGRPLCHIPTEAAEGKIRGGRVLVTGAGGSVGSALVRALAGLHPERIIAIDSHEASLFRLGRDTLPAAPIELRLADIRNQAKLTRIFVETRPNLVFHLAAYKHVPLGEQEPDEPVSVNVLGTEALLQAASEAGVQEVVYPSSDKAVNPPSIYGATKRLAEALLDFHAGKADTPSIHVVRYVNVIGSSGSVIESFFAQARAGQPLTITDQAMTRYWMAMSEAIAVLWHAIGLPSGSKTVLDTGVPVAVREMAARVSRLVSGADATPDLIFTGARPGERLAEELSSATETLVRVAGDPVLRIEQSGWDQLKPRVPSMIKEVRELLAMATNAALRARVMEMAHQLQ